MLNYHKIQSQPAKTTIALYNHFLTLGSHNTVISIPPLLSLSEVKLYPDHKLIINQDKSQQGLLHVLVPLSGGLRIDEKVRENGEVVFGGKFVNEVDSKQGRFVYLEYQGENKDTPAQTIKLSENEVNITSKLSLKHITLTQGQSLELNKRILIYIISGKIKPTSTNQQFQQGECLYTKNGCGQVQAVSPTSILLFDLKDEQ